MTACDECCANAMLQTTSAHLVVTPFLCGLISIPVRRWAAAGSEACANRRGTPSNACSEPWRLAVQQYSSTAGTAVQRYSKYSCCTSSLSLSPCVGRGTAGTAAVSPAVPAVIWSNPVQQLTRGSPPKVPVRLQARVPSVHNPLTDAEYGFYESCKAMTAS